MKFCTKCGTKLNDDDLFCTKCGCEEPQFESHTETTSVNDKETRKIKKNILTNKRNKAYICPIIFGIVLILIGLLIPTPGGVLTTYESLDGVKTEDEDYVFDNKYSSIDKYIIGDAYNYIIGASLVAGRISGTMTTKTIIVVGGVLCLCFGITLNMLQKTTNATHTNETKEGTL